MKRTEPKRNQKKNKLTYFKAGLQNRVNSLTQLKTCAIYFVVHMPYSFFFCFKYGCSNSKSSYQCLYITGITTTTISTNIPNKKKLVNKTHFLLFYSDWEAVWKYIIHILCPFGLVNLTLFVWTDNKMG